MADRWCEVAIIGAGPYGLASAAHLREAGVTTRAFGRAMEFWTEQMPKGMCLRSPRCASHIADPGRRLTLDRFEAARRIRLGAPIPLEDFVRYGRWFQREAVPDLDGRRVARVDPLQEGFRVVTSDGERLLAERVVVATGIGTFARRLSLFEGLPRELVSHAADHADLARFAGKRICVVGGGQSALESAALLSEAGAEVEVLVRAAQIRWLGQHLPWLKSRLNPVRPLLYHPTDVGPPGLNWLNATPDLFRRLPRQWQERIAYRSIRPAGSPWLPPRLQGVQFTLGRRIEAATAAGDELRLTLDDGSERRAAHLLQATGYKVDVALHRFLSPELLARLERVDGYPVLSAGFESSVPGLHFLGAPGAYSFGPLCRFVSGSGYAARSLTARVLGNRGPQRRPGAPSARTAAPPAMEEARSGLQEAL